MTAPTAVVGIVREARIAAKAGLEVVVGGAGLSASLARRTVGIISFGLAGGLDPALRAGDLVIATAVSVGGKRLATDPVWTDRLADAMPSGRRAVIAGAERFVVAPADRAALRGEAGADAVDTESHLAADFARRWQLPFAVVRAICDDATMTLPPAALVGLRADGRIDLGGVLVSLARRPAQLPALLAIASDAERAFRALKRAAAAIAACGVSARPGDARAWLGAASRR